MSAVDTRKNISFTSEIEEKCPFCQGRFQAGGLKEGEEAGVLHSVPPCEKFIALEPIAFLRAVRIRLTP
jgi:hypothetical protein